MLSPRDRLSDTVVVALPREMSRTAIAIVLAVLLVAGVPAASGQLQAKGKSKRYTSCIPDNLSGAQEGSLGLGQGRRSVPRLGGGCCWLQRGLCLNKGARRGEAQWNASWSNQGQGKHKELTSQRAALLDQTQACGDTTIYGRGSLLHFGKHLGLKHSFAAPPVVISLLCLFSCGVPSWLRVWRNEQQLAPVLSE